MSNLKLEVEVISAHNLLPIGEHGSSNPFVELHFNGQMCRTTTKEHDLDPLWNENFHFDVADPSNLISLTLDVYVYHKIRTTNSSAFLGKVSLPGLTLFVPYSDAIVLKYPLEKRGLFSRVRGELCLKIYVTDDRSVKSPMKIPSVKSSPNKEPNSTQAQAPTIVHSATNTSSNDKRVAQGDVIHKDNPAKTYTLVERIYFLYVRVVKARDLPMINFIGSIDPFVEVNIGKYRGFTEHLESKRDPEWNQVFAFSRERMQASELEVAIKHKDLVKDDLVGNVRFDINEVPLILSPEISVDPEWYQLEDKKGNNIKGDLMLAVWIGTQADKAFPDAWHADAATPFGCTPSVARVTCSKVYHAPRLWCLRVNVIEAQDLYPGQDDQLPNFYVKIKLLNSVLKTRICQALNPIWNEDLLVVAAEPFEDHLVLSVEYNVAPGKDETIGRAIIPLNYVQKRADDRNIYSTWYNLERPVSVKGDQLKKDKFFSRIHLRVCLEGGYHVLAESPEYSSDYRPLARQLWEPSIGVLELGILNAEGLFPMKTRDGRGTSDTYCVAKYGHKWVRTRTIAGSLFPIFNEQYTWEVFDLATVLTIGVFENNQLLEGKNNINDQKIGKARIRLSTLEAGRVYTHAYPLLIIHPTGVKKSGELHLAIRFSCGNYVKMLYQYSRPLLPKMHYKRPFPIGQLDMLRHQAISTVAMRIGRAEPPLRKEVVEHMYEVESHFWSLRRSKANFFRLMSVFSGLLSAGRWFGDICLWRNPITTVLVHVLYLMFAYFPVLILPALFLYVFLRGIWNYRYRPRYPLHMDTRISHAESVHLDELDEEFDTFPTSRSPDLVRTRYDRLRSVAGRIQTVAGDFAMQGERFQALLSWRDPRATAIVVVFSLAATLVFSLVSPQVIATLAGFYVMRHPIFRDNLPSVPLNFFRRLPSRVDSLL